MLVLQSKVISFTLIKSIHIGGKINNSLKEKAKKTNVFYLSSISD